MKKIIIILSLLLLISCDLYDMSDVMVERRYTIIIEHCTYKGLSVVAENIQKHNKAPMEFYISNCSLYYKVYAYQQHPERIKMIFSNVYKFSIDGKNSPLYSSWKDTTQIN